MEEIDRWAGYYRYFYFFEEMSFEKFLQLVEIGSVPQRSYVDWNKVGRNMHGNDAGECFIVSSTSC